jgi:hypothetical protein
VYTSNFARLKTIPDGLRPVGIAVGPPRWYRGETMLELAPTREMLHLSYAEYVVQFQLRLEVLDPKQIADRLGDNAVMLCWESPGVFCHRRAVAQWLERHLNIEIPELGFDRQGFPEYPNMPPKRWKPPKVLATQVAKQKRKPYTRSLFD